MSRQLYKLFAVAVTISMIVALPAVALPQTISSVTRSESNAPLAPEAKQAVPALDDPVLEIAGPGDESELPQAALPKTGLAKIVIELVDEPATVAYATAQAANKSKVDTVAATQAQVARIEAEQQALLSTLDKLEATVIYRTQRVYNGIAAIVDVEKLDELAQQPGVKAIHPLISKSLDNWHSVPLIGASQLWDQAGVFGGLDGTGIKVGVIDTGIDYMHANFGGLAVSGVYTTNDTTVITDTYNGNLMFPTMKVVGGWDFAGDDYDANPSNPTYNPIPSPDPDPADCGDHGSHVAGTAAGYGVNANGTTFTGTYNSALDFSQFKIGPGVAPKAELYSLRVFGCEGSTDLTDQAIEWAVDPNGDGDFSDHLDVINMSLGSSYGSIYDSSAVASDNAALAGVVVVMSSGNSGDIYYVTGSPGIAARGISVAGTDDGAAILDGFRVVTPASLAGVHPGSESVLYDWTSPDLPVTGTLVYPLPGANPAQDQRTGCYTYDITNTQIISGNFVLQDWNEPSCLGSVGRGANAVAAGAKGVIMVDNFGAFDLFISGSSVIPAYSAPKVVGDALKVALSSDTVQLVMTNEYKGSVPYNEPAYQNTVYSSSSRGPRRGDSLLKPDIAAPAVSVFSTQNAWPWNGKGDGTTGVSYNGTSMAAPHVAGSMALLKQLHPDWSVEELKSLAMNTATTDVTQANGALPKYTPGRIGAGRITLPNAASSDVIAFNATEPYLTSVSFGAVEVSGTTAATKQIAVANKSNQLVRYQVSYQSYADVPGVSYSVTPAEIALPAQSTALISVTMTADAAQMKHSSDPTVSTPAGRSWLSEASGYVILEPIIVTYTLVVNTAGSGVINLMPAGGVYSEGTVVTLTAVPDPHWSFVAWSGDVSSSINPLVITMDGNKTITGTFALNNYALTVNVAGNGVGTVVKSPDAASYPYGTVVTLTATPSSTSYFAGWSGDIIGTTTPEAITVDGDKVITATFNSHQIYLPLITRNATGTTYTVAKIDQLMPGQHIPTMLRVPVHAVPRPASEMSATVSTISFTSVTGTASIPLAGTAISTGLSYPTDIVSLVSAFELAEISPNELGYPGTDNADLKYVGVTNNNRVATGGFVTNTTLYFGVSTWGDHNTAYAADAEFDIYIDRDRNGTWDYVVYNAQAGNDIFATRVVNLSTQAGVYDQYVNVTPSLDTYPFNNSVIILPVSASRLGLSNANPRFDYQILTYSREDPTESGVDASAKHTYSAAAAGLDFTNGSATGPVWFDLPGTNLNVNFDQAAYIANGTLGALLLHHHNAAGQREEVINVTPSTNYAFVTLMHTNDFHGNLEPAGSNPGIARLANKIKQVRNEVNSANTLLLDAGDIMQSSLLSNLKKGEPTIDLYNFVGYNVATFGNHEFDWGQQVLISRTLQATFPFVVSNLVVNDTGNCATAGWTTPVSLTVKPWITKTVGAPGNQAVIGILGTASIETPYITIASATEGLCFKNPAEAIAHHYNDVKAAGADVIVVLSHNGLNDGGYGYGFTVEGERTLARKLVEQDTPANLIIGGHSHIDMAAAEVVSGTTVAQAHYAGRKLGRADLIINKATDTATIKWTRLVVGTSDPEDAATKARVNVWAQDPVYQAQINQVIGFSNVDLVRNYDGDNLMGALVNDSIYNDLNTDENPVNDVDMVFNNSGGLRTDLTSITKPFTLTYGMMYSILPFGNATLVGDMTGAQVQDLLNQAATLFKGAIQVSGIRYSFYAYTDTLPNTAQPWAWGAYSVTVKNRSTGIWEPLVMTKTYRIATNEFLAPAGQDGFSQFKYVTNYSYWGDMLDGVNRWVSKVYSTTASAYNGPNNDGLLDGRITRNGTSTYNPADPNQVVPVNVLHHNDGHGRLLPSGSAPGYTNLVTLINRERAHNPNRTLLLNAGDTIQGDAMAAYYKAAFTGLAPDGTSLPISLTVNPILKSMNAMTYTAMTLGNHEFNYGSTIFTGTLGQATFPLVQANIYDSGAYGLAQVNVQPHVTVTLPGPAGNINIAVLGIGNHRIPNYELPSNIPGLTFTNPITEAQNRAPALKAVNDAVIALTHIGFTADPNSIEVDTNVDTVLAAQTTGVDAILGGHSHTRPDTGFGPYKFLPTFVGAPDNTPVIINQAYRYNSYLGEIVLGMLPKAGGGYEVVSRAGRYIANSTSIPEDVEVKAIIQPYDEFFQTYKNRTLGQTITPIDTLNAFTQETNGANLQVDASLWKLTSTLAIPIDFHLSGAMTNQRIGATATPATPYTMTVNDMFTLMPYENSLVVMEINGAELKAILERGFRNYWYYKNTSNAGGYSKYTTCMLDVSAGAVITYQDTMTYTPGTDYVVGMSLHGSPIDFTAATTYTVSTVNYLAAGSCNFNDSGVSLWPISQIVADTQYYVRDVMIDYVPLLPQPINPQIEGRLIFLP